MKISVIVPTWNSGAVLPRALQSVWSQKYPDIEIIVMDGGSTDGTVAWLEQNSSRLTLWRSEPDDGTTDALNKGLKVATGEVVTFLCADDYFVDPGVFAEIARTFQEEPETEMIAANLRVEAVDGLKATEIWRSDPTQMHRRMSVYMPGAFLRRSLLGDRQFSRAVEVANDYELFAYLLRVKKAKLLVLDRVTLAFATGGRSDSPRMDFQKARDCLYVRRTYFGFWDAWPAFGRDLVISSLRRVGFRPLTWLRNLRSLFSRPQANR